MHPIFYSASYSIIYPHVRRKKEEINLLWARIMTRGGQNETKLSWGELCEVVNERLDAEIVTKKLTPSPRIHFGWKI